MDTRKQLLTFLIATISVLVILNLLIFNTKKQAVKNTQITLDTIKKVDSMKRRHQKAALQPTHQPKNPSALHPLEEKLLGFDLVDAQSLDPTLQVDLKYGSFDNFTKTNLYDNFQKCYLQEEVARMLTKAQEFLKEQDPTQSLLLLDCARPQSIQKKMWEIVKNTPEQRYVASPYGGGSMHSYGTAVDITIVDKEGKQLDMGTPYDYFGELAQPRYNQKFANSGDLTPEQLTNRVKLRAVMKKAGFRPIESEWWHFSAFNKRLTRNRYRLID